MHGRPLLSSCCSQLLLVRGLATLSQPECDCGRSDGAVNAVDDRQVSRAAGDCASPACQASWVSSVRGPWCGTPNSGEGNEDVRPCSNTECAASALILCSLWVWGTFWTVGRLSLFGYLQS